MHDIDFQISDLTKTLCRENKCPYSFGPPSLRNQIPLDLGWASTVHKGQCRTLHPAVYDANGQFASGGRYTACSHAPALSELHLIQLGEMSEYFVEPSIKKLLVWLDDHDVCRGWDDRRKRSVSFFYIYIYFGFILYYGVNSKNSCRVFLVAERMLILALTVSPEAMFS
jgi:hypothetical protein